MWRVWNWGYHSIQQTNKKYVHGKVTLIYRYLNLLLYLTNKQLIMIKNHQRRRKNKRDRIPVEITMHAANNKKASASSINKKQIIHNKLRCAVKHFGEKNASCFQKASIPIVEYSADNADLDLLKSDDLKEMIANPIYRTTIIARQNKKEKYEDELVLKNSSRNPAICSSSYLLSNDSKPVVAHIRNCISERALQGQDFLELLHRTMNPCKPRVSVATRTCNHIFASKILSQHLFSNISNKGDTCGAAGLPQVSKIMKGLKNKKAQKTLGFSNETVTVNKVKITGKSAKVEWTNAKGEGKEGMQIGNDFSRFTYESKKTLDLLTVIEREWKKAKVLPVWERSVSYKISEYLKELYHVVQEYFPKWFEMMNSSSHHGAFDFQTFCNQYLHMTTNIINNNSLMHCHQDTKPVHGFPAVLTCNHSDEGKGRDSMIGGELVIVKLGFILDYRRGDVVILDGQYHHAVLPLTNDSASRFSVVLYNNGEKVEKNGA